MNKLRAILFLGINVIALNAKMPNQWSIHNCNYKEHDITWRIYDKHHDLNNSLSKCTVEAVYPLPDIPFNKTVNLTIGKHRPFLHHVGPIKAPASGDTLHIWWDAHDKEYRVSYNQCGILVNTAQKTADAFSNAVQSTTNAVKDKAHDVVENAKDVSHRTAETVKYAAAVGADKAKNLGAKAGKEVKETAQTVADKTKSAAQTVAEKTRSAAEIVSKKASNAYDATKAKVHEMTQPDNHANVNNGYACKEPGCALHSNNRNGKEVIYVQDAEVTVVRK